MNLTDSQRRQILRRNYPFLKLEPDAAKALEPSTVTINQQVWVEVRGVKRDKKAGWFVDYAVHDYRPRLMRRNPGGGAYTHSVQLAVAQEDVDAVPEDYQKELTVRARNRHLQTVESEHAEDLARRQVKSFADAIRGVAVKQARAGIDPGPTLARFLREMEQELDQKKEAA